MSEISLLQVTLTLLVAAFLLIGAEIYVPGGILGTLGALCLIAAVILGFRMSPTRGWMVAGAALGLTAFGLFFWLRVFPRSSAGRRLTLELDGRNFKTGKPEWEALLGREGIAQSDLRPSGVALLDGRRIDVLSENGLWIAEGARVRVARVSGSRVYVEALTPPSGESAS
ncbi:MAG: NfeD family protein [Kiritimatiellia bacterium]|nr:NfeD family protein [Kiritimatiellia bacterium]